MRTVRATGLEADRRRIAGAERGAGGTGVEGDEGWPSSSLVRLQFPWMSVDATGTSEALGYPKEE